MKFDKQNLLLYAVTDRSWLGEKTLFQQVEEALQGGVTMLQLREKDLDEKSFMEEAAAVKELCARYQVPFLIDDNVPLALRCGAMRACGPVRYGGRRSTRQNRPG